MFKRFAAVLFVVSILLLLGGCGAEPTIVMAGEDNTATGSKGDIMRTPQIDFVVENVRALSKFGGEAPVKGDMFVDVTISITNTSEADAELHDMDFQLQWGSSGFADPMVAFDDRMAPMDFTVGPGESVEYHFIYSVPKSITDFRICYLHKPVGEERPQLLYVEFTL